MKKTSLFAVLLFSFLSINAALAPGLKWEEVYSFDRNNAFKMDMFAKNNELMRTSMFRTYYQTTGENFVTKYITDKKGMGGETVIDKKNELAIQIFGEGGGAKPMYNAGGYKYPEADDMNKLEIVATAETKQIAGVLCKKYTYTFKKIFGEVWITDQIKLPNDLGVFRACKMAALHNTLSVQGFVMEMTTEDLGGGRTLMTTLSLQNIEKYEVDLRGVEMNKALNKVNYYSF